MFIEIWLEEETFIETIKEGLAQTTRGTCLYRFQYRLQEAKSRAKQWAAAKGNSTKLIQETRLSLDSTAIALETNPIANQKCGIKEEAKGSAPKRRSRPKTKEQGNLAQGRR